MTDKEKIRAEIERLWNKLKEEKPSFDNYATGSHDGKLELVCDLLSFIDSMQEELKIPIVETVDGGLWNGNMQEEPISEDWEEAYRNWVLSHNDGDKLYCKNAWRAAMDWQKQHDKMPVSEELGEYINKLSKQFPEVSFAKLSRIAVRVAKWQKEQDQEHPDKESFAKRLKLEKEEWEDEYRQQMMKESVEATIMHYYSQSKKGFNGRVIFCSDSLDYLNTGDKVRIKVFKEDQICIKEK